MAPTSEHELDELLSEPPGYLIDVFRSLPGDVLVLGAGGKMGPSLCRMAARAGNLAGQTRKVIAVSRFTDPALPRRLAASGVDVICGDLLVRSFVESLPDSPLVVVMTGQKFGTSSGGAARTWAMNVLLPARVCERFPKSRIAAFSSGNVYGLVSVADRRGSREDDVPHPVGEYAMSVLGRERIYEYFSLEHKTPMSILRLNYATEMRYGVLVDIARRVWNRQPVPVAMGYVNVIWQGDANAIALASLCRADVPPFVLNVAGPDYVRTREVAEQFGERFGMPVTFTGEEAPAALLNDATLSHRLFGAPRVATSTMIHWIADWIRSGGAIWEKPTHFEVLDGRFY